MTTETREERKYLRFPTTYRIEHWVQALAFIVLAITGLIQRGAGLTQRVGGQGIVQSIQVGLGNLSNGLIALVGGIENTRIIHRIAAVVLMLLVVYHLGIVIYRMYVKRYRPSMLPTTLDIKAAWQTLIYNLGFSKQRPQQGRYTFEEKAEYWALVWGMIIMIITGFMLWNPIATTRFLPGEAVPAAKAAHGNEALLAVLAIILWHLYHVLVRTFNKSMFNGYLTEEQMIHDHPLELADIKAGVHDRPVNPKNEAQRRKVFWPFYGIVGAGLLAGIYAFVTFEETAVAVPPKPEDVTVFVPLTPTPLPTLPPTATAAPAAENGAVILTWEGGMKDLFSTCTGCHGTLGGINLSSYASALAGGVSGPGIVPGIPEESVILQVQEAGHPTGQLSPEQIETLREWIAAGAPEK